MTLEELQARHGIVKGCEVWIDADGPMPMSGIVSNVWGSMANVQMPNPNEPHYPFEKAYSQCRLTRK